MALPGSADLDPGSLEKPMKLWCISFETECRVTWIIDLVKLCNVALADNLKKSSPSCI